MRNQRISHWHAVLLATIIPFSGCVHESAHLQTNSMTASPASPTAKPPMHSQIFQWNDLEARSTEVSTVRNAFDAPTATLADFSCHATTLNPGKAPHPAHRHP